MYLMFTIPPKYIPDSNHVILYEPLQIKENLTYVEEPIQILKRGAKLRNGIIPYVKVLCRDHKGIKAT